MDLDDILDSAAADVLPPKVNPNKERIVSGDIKPWLAYTANVPKETRDNWTKISKMDTDADMPSMFQLSYAYRAWEGSSSGGGAQNNGVNKCLQEMIRKTAFKCGIDDARTAKILSVVNPVSATDKESVKQINRVFSKQIVTDMKDDIVKDPNYDAAKFPNLAAAL